MFSFQEPAASSLHTMPGEKPSAEGKSLLIFSAQGDPLVCVCFSVSVGSTLMQPSALWRFITICQTFSCMHYNLTGKASLLGPLRLCALLQTPCQVLIIKHTVRPSLAQMTVEYPPLGCEKCYCQKLQGT